jgi:hypothetical protein
MAQSNQDIERAVYLLWHTDKHGDEKLIGVYGTKEQATSAITRTKDKPGFSDTGGEFEIARYELNKDHWTEGFVRREGLSLPKWFRLTDSKQ